MARPLPFCYAAMVPAVGVVPPGSNQQAILFKFGDTADPVRDLNTLSLSNPSTTGVARNVTAGKGNFQGYINVGIWLRHNVFQNRNFQPVRTKEGNATEWYIVYLRTNQASTIRSFVRDWDRMAWDLATTSGQQNLINYLNGTVFPQVSSRPA